MATSNNNKTKDLFEFIERNVKDLTPEENIEIIKILLRNKYADEALVAFLLVVNIFAYENDTYGFRRLIAKFSHTERNELANECIKDKLNGHAEILLTSVIEENARENEFTQAVVLLSYMYEENLGDPRKALSIYLKYADRCDGRALYNISIFYIQGDGIPPNYEEALYWLRRSAAKGYSEANKLAQDVKNYIDNKRVIAEAEHRIRVNSMISNNQHLGNIERELRDINRH